MAKLPRVTNKLFAENAATDDIGQFGSANAGTKLNTSDVTTIQALQAWKEGWKPAVVGENRYPAIQERNGVDKVFSYQIDYMLQQGIAEYDAGTTYYKGSIIKSLDTNNKPVLYNSLVDDNVGNPLSDNTKWEIYIKDDAVNRNLSNLTDEGKAKFDEKWTNSNYIIVFEGRNLSTSLTLVPFTLDFLPDNGEYEILFTAGVTLLYNNTYCYGSISISSDIINTPFPCVRISGNASTGDVYIKGTVILPVKNKKIYLSGDTANQNSNGDLVVVGYRKLGVGFDTTT